MRYFLILILIAISANAAADQNKEAALRFLIASGVKASMEDSEKEFYNSMKQQVEFTQKKISGGVALGTGKRTIEVQNNLLKRASKIASQYLSWESHKDELAQAYMETYSLEELNAISRFFESDIGKLYIEKEVVIRKRLQGMQGRISLAMRPATEALAESMESELEAAIAEDMKLGK